MGETVWQAEYAVETNASLSFAWRYWTDIAHWVDPPAQFEIDGPFASGSRGTTRLPGQDPVHWLLKEVRPEQSYTIEWQMDRATLNFEWTFDEVSPRKTKIAQRILLSGDNAFAYVEPVEAGFGSNLRAGMDRIAATIARAQGEAGSD